jgi:transposase
MNKTKEYAIKYLLSQKKSPEEIAKELKVSISIVKSYQTEEKTKPAKTDKTKELMIRQTSSKKSNSVSIMTEAASQVSDEFIKNIGPSTKNTNTYIFRPNK